MEITTADACARAGISRQRLMQLITEGRIKARLVPGRCRGRWLINEASFEAWHTSDRSPGKRKLQRPVRFEVRFEVMMEGDVKDKLICIAHQRGVSRNELLRRIIAEWMERENQ